MIWDHVYGVALQVLNFIELVYGWMDDTLERVSYPLN